MSDPRQRMFASDATLLQIRHAWPGLSEELADLPPLRVAIFGTYTVDPLQPYLGYALAQKGLRLEWVPVPYNQLYQQLLQPDSVLNSALKTAGAGVVVLLPRIEELLSSAWSQLPGNAVGAREVAARELDNLARGIGTFVADFGGLLLAGNFMRPAPLPLGLMDASSADGGTAFTEWINVEWRSRLNYFPTVRLLDVAGLMADEGRRAAFDSTRWHLGKIPFKESAMKELAVLISRSAAAWFLPPKKVVVVDCDGTLWGGIVGEDGVEGLMLGDVAPGNAYASFQHYILGLLDRGFLLALCSKNNEDEVWSVFNKHPSMVLKREHFAAWRINWDAKSANLRQIALELNLGTDSFVLIDDNPAECAEVKAQLPEVAVSQLPEDPAEFVETAESSGFFDRLTLTREDSVRQRHYQIERQRTELHNKMSAEEYLSSLELVVDIFTPSAADLARVAQLVNKTNQFNLTTLRRTEGEVRSLASNPACWLYAVNVSDRFGDYGLTGVAIVCRGRDHAELDTFLLSCRVLGRRVERQLLAKIVGDCRAQNISHLRARFVPTSKNQSAVNFLNENGFTDPDAEGWQLLEVGTHCEPNGVALGQAANTIDA